MKNQKKNKKVNKNCFLFLATEARKDYFQFFSMNAYEIRKALPDWLIKTIELIPRNSLMWDFEKERGHPCYWEDLLQTLFVRSSEKEISFQTTTRIQNSPFGKHFNVSFNDNMPKKIRRRKDYRFTFDLFFEMVGKKIVFSNEEGYLVISFTN